jgi:hypothetical protein
MSSAFDSDDTQHMSRALDQAWSQLGPSGLSNGDGEAREKAVLTRAILEAAEQGMRNEDKLAAYALAHYARMRNAMRERPSAAAIGAHVER